MPDKDTSAALVDDASSSLDDISQKLVDARLNAEPLGEFPGPLPDTLAEAYEIQTLSIRRWPDEVGGWKVGGVPERLQQRFQTDRLAGPIFQTATHSVPDRGTQQMPIFAGGFAAIEAEFVVRTATSIAPSDTIETDAELLDRIDALHVGAEIASSPMADINRIGPICVVSDFGNNGGLVVGPEVPDWRSRLADSIAVTVRVDENVVGSVKTVLRDSVLGAFRFLVRLSADRGLTLPAGTLISCGALSGIHDVGVGALAAVEFAGLGSFEVQFTKRQAAV